MDYHGLSWATMGDHGLSGILIGRVRIVDYSGLYGFSWIMNCRVLSRIVMDYPGLPWIIADADGLSCIIVDY